MDKLDGIQSSPERKHFESISYYDLIHPPKKKRERKAKPIPKIGEVTDKIINEQELFYAAEQLDFMWASITKKENEPKCFSCGKTFVKLVSRRFIHYTNCFFRWHPLNCIILCESCLKLDLKTGSFESFLRNKDLEKYNLLIRSKKTRSRKLTFNFYTEAHKRLLEYNRK